MNPPSVTREQLLADERAAERAVCEAEAVWLASLVMGGAAEQRAATALDEARARSRVVRQAMLDGFEAWTQYAAYQEALAHAAANGVALPPTVSP